MAAVIRRTKEGFVRRYDDGSELRAFHLDYTPKIDDRERCALVRQRDALVEIERRLRTMCVIGELCGLGDYGLSRFKRELHETENALQIVRQSMHPTWDRLDMAPEEVS